MTADVEAMFSVREMPWHRDGVVLGDYPESWADVRRLAGMDWDPLTEPVYALAGIAADGTPRYEPIVGWQRIVRSDTGDTLWINQDSYEVIDHDAMGAIVEAVLAQPNVKWETGGVLDQGRAVWCLARLDEPIALPGDDTVTLPYMAMTTRHGKPGACTLRATAVRIVCGNTFRAAELEGDRTGTTFSFRHTKNWREHLEQAREAVTGTRREIAAYAELARQLLDVRVSPGIREQFVAAFIPMPPEGLVTERVVRNVEEARKALRLILASETTAPVAHTGYGLVQAAGEYLDHVRRARSWETKLGRTLMRPEPLKAKALTLVRQLAAV
jgi:phage/plasmid-like protein (TIGR03299 family)